MKIKSIIINKFSLVNSFRALRYRNYRLFVSGQSLSLIGTWIQQIAMGWLIYEMTGSAFILGIAGFFSRIPTFILAPFTGVIADRYNKYKLLLLTQILSLVQSAILTVLILSGSAKVWQIIFLGTILGMVNSLDTPVRQSFVIDMIDEKDDLANAIAINSAMVNGARLIGPSVAGILIATLGAGWCFMINSLSYIPVIIAIIMMNINPVKYEKRRTSPLKDFIDGLKYAYDFTPIRYLLLLLTLISLTGWPYQVLMPVFAKDIFRGGAHTLGFLMAAVGSGALTGAIYLAAKRSVLGFGKLIVVASLVFGLGLVVFSFIHNFYFAIPVLFMVGFGMMVHMTSSNTLIQTLVENEKRGRVMSLYTMAFLGTVPFGNLIGGVLADTIGVSYTVFAGGLSCICGALYFAKLLPSLRLAAKPVFMEKKIISE